MCVAVFLLRIGIMLRFIVIIILSLSHHNNAQNVQPPRSGTFPVDDVLKNLNNTIDVNEAQICAEPRRCINHYQCLEDGTFNKRGAGIVSPRFGQEDDSNMLLDGKDVYQVSTNSTIVQKNGIEARVCHYLELCCSSAPVSKIEIPVVASTNMGCGYRNPNGLFFNISNADKAQYGEFPWMVAVILINPADKMPPLIGGGSLIHPSFILTAAHLFHTKAASEFKVRAGEWDTQTKIENLPHQERNVKEIILHENYDSHGFLNDYALLMVDKPFVLGPNIQPICLPTPNLYFEEEQDCYSAGWGNDKFDISGRRQSIMKKVKLPIVPFDTCQNQLRKTELGDIFELHESFVCAGGLAGEDTCTGDGGSPLMCPVHNQNEKNRYYQVGIVAWGLGCGEKDIPGVYADILSARQWIDGVMQRYGFGNETYSIK